MESRPLIDQMGHEAGFDHQLANPVDPKGLIDLFARMSDAEKIIIRK